ncbi:hypothetical protein LW972_17995, partial [Erwinia amylovora]
LQARTAGNPNWRLDVIDALESNRLQVLSKLAEAGWSLDALRLIVVTHQ